MTTATTTIWLDGNGREAAQEWTSLIDDSRIVATTELQLGERPIYVIEIVLAGTTYLIMDSPRQEGLTPATSITVTVPDQATLDRYWDGILAAGGHEMACGWVVDRFGLCWQIIPATWKAHMSSQDPAHRQRVAEALWGMVRIDVAALDAAAQG